MQAVIELVRRRLAGQSDIGAMLADLHEAKEGAEYRCGECEGKRQKRWIRLSEAGSNSG